MNGRRGEDIWEKAETDTDQYLEYMKMNKKMVGNPTEKREQRLRTGKSQKEEPKLVEEQEKMFKEV